MSIKIGHATVDEKGTWKNGAAGDNTGGEVCIRSWYNRPWNVILRCTDSKMAEKIAVAMERACANNKIGYDQNQRNTLLTQARKVGYNPAKVTTKCETDCSALVSLCCMYAGIKESALYKSGNSSTTSVLRSRLLATGKFKALTASKYLTSGDYLKRGDILLYEGHHTAVALENGSKAIKTSTSTKETSTLKAGQKVKLTKVSLYASATAGTAAGKISGTYYLWDSKVSNGRVRITNSASNVGKAGQITGWIKKSAI